jgi:hypothetical protein
MINIKDKLTQLMRTLTRRGGTDREMPIETAEEAPKALRSTQRPTDIPLDRIEGTYTPTQTSLKAPFRASGADRQRDQEFARGVDDNHWNDEDRFTNKSNDPRIGTHGRTYEPGERRAENDEGGR